jgi:hypothetical protein
MKMTPQYIDAKKGGAIADPAVYPGGSILLFPISSEMN